MPRPPNLTNLLASAAVALVVSATVGTASPTPSTHGISTAALSAKPLPAAAGPSIADQLAALRRRVDANQNRDAETRRIALTAQNIALAADEITGCINGALYVTFDDEGNLVSASRDDQDADPVATLDPECVSTEDAS